MGVFSSVEGCGLDVCVGAFMCVGMWACAPPSNKSTHQSIKQSNKPPSNPLPNTHPTQSTYQHTDARPLRLPIPARRRPQRPSCPPPLLLLLLPTVQGRMDSMGQSMDRGVGPVRVEAKPKPDRPALSLSLLPQKGRVPMDAHVHQTDAYNTTAACTARLPSDPLIHTQQRTCYTTPAPQTRSRRRPPAGGRRGGGAGGTGGARCPWRRWPCDAA